MRPICLALVIVVGLTTFVVAEESQSNARAKALIERLTEKHLDAAATMDPDNAGRVIAAIYVPPSQLLVVRAKREDAQLLSQTIRDGKYRDVYTDLQMAPVTDGKLFIHDIGADGLNWTGKSVLDNVYEGGVRAELTKSHSDRFARLDAEYARMLGALLSALDEHPAPASSGDQVRTSASSR